MCVASKFPRVGRAEMLRDPRDSGRQIQTAIDWRDQPDEGALLAHSRERDHQNQCRLHGARGVMLQKIPDVRFSNFYHFTSHGDCPLSLSLSLSAIHWA